MGATNDSVQEAGRGAVGLSLEVWEVEQVRMRVRLWCLRGLAEGGAVDCQGHGRCVREEEYLRVGVRGVWRGHSRPQENM